MPVKASDLYDRIVRDDLSPLSPQTPEGLRIYLHAAQTIFQKEIAGNYFFRDEGRTLVVDHTGPHFLSGHSFSPPVGYYGVSLAVNKTSMEQHLLFEETELTPAELRDLQQFRQGQTKKASPAGAW
jgi:hypothetical protein